MVQSKDKGTPMIKISHGEIDINEVIYIPGMDDNLLFLGKMDGKLFLFL